MFMFRGLNLNIDIGLIIIEGIVIFSLIILMIKILKGRKVLQARGEFMKLDPLIKWIKEGETLCERLLKFTPSIENLINSQTPPTFFKKGSLLSKGFEAQILKMADAGYHISEIAQSTGLSPGEVRFVLDWIKYKKSLTDMVEHEHSRF